MRMLDLIKAFAMAFVIVSGVSAQMVWDGTADQSWYDAGQSEFTITTAEQLAGLAELVNGGNYREDLTITLGADIVLNDTGGWEDWATTPPANQWTAIGEFIVGANYSFRGTFDGAGFTVSGVYINSPNDIQGLFGYTENATIKNLGVVASYVKGGDFNIGGLAGFIDYGTTIDNCYAAGNVEGNEYVGGLVGYTNSESKIENSCAAGNVTGTDYVGGLAGSNFGDITNCYSTGNVSGNSDVGGLVGENFGTIENSYAIGSVSGNSDVGGLVGIDSNGDITDCYYDSETSGQSDNDGRGTPKTTAEMKQKSTYEKWDFYEVWAIDGNKNGGYPYLDLREFVEVGSISGVSASAIYGDNITLNAVIEPNSATSQTIVWSVESGEAEIDGNDITFTAAGTVTIRATVEYGLKTGNYTQEFTITVAKADPTYTVPSGLTAKVGQTLADVTLTGGWSWMNAATSVGEAGERTFKAKFTPDDIANYNVIENIDVIVTVAANDVSIKDAKKSDNNGYGIKFANSVARDKLEIVEVKLPDGDKLSEIVKVVIYDNTGNVVYSGKETKWNLTNSSGRFVANGAYLVIVEAKGRNGKSYWYSAKIGVNRK